MSASDRCCNNVARPLNLKHKGNRHERDTKACTCRFETGKTAWELLTMSLGNTRDSDSMETPVAMILIVLITTITKSK